MATNFPFSPRLGRRRMLALLAGLPAALAFAGPVLAASSGQDLAASGQTLLASGNLAEALSVLREAAKADPANPWVWNLLGRACLGAGDPVQAAQAFRMALRADPGDGYSQMMLDRLSQRPLPAQEAKPVDPRQASRRRPSPLEEQAQAERQAFLEGRQVRGALLVVLDAGHGGLDPGVTGQGGLLEKTVTLDLALRLAAALKERGVETALTREADYAVPLWARAAMARLHGADALVSLHATAAEVQAAGALVYARNDAPKDQLASGVAALENGVTRFERPGAPGPETGGLGGLLGGWKTARVARRSAALAEGLAKVFAGPAPLQKIQASGAPLTLLGLCGAPAVLVECGFLSTQASAQALSGDGFRQQAAQALAQALAQVLPPALQQADGSSSPGGDGDAARP